MFFERLDVSEEQDVAIGDFVVTILYEEPREGFTYGCSPLDVIKVLKTIATAAPGFPNFIAFRQPTRKQQQQQPVWGRFLYSVEFGKQKTLKVLKNL